MKNFLLRILQMLSVKSIRGFFRRRRDKKMTAQGLKLTVIVVDAHVEEIHGDKIIIYY